MLGVGRLDERALRQGRASGCVGSEAGKRVEAVVGEPFWLSRGSVELVLQLRDRFRGPSENESSDTVSTRHCSPSACVGKVLAPSETSPNRDFGAWLKSSPVEILFVNWS